MMPPNDSVALDIEIADNAVAGFAENRDRMLAGIGSDFGKWRPDLAVSFVPMGGTPPLSVAQAFAGAEGIDLLKIDVEGFELGIIQEMKELGLLPKTQVIVGEWHFENARLGLMDAFSETHDFVHENPPDGNPWNIFSATRRD